MLACCVIQTYVDVLLSQALYMDRSALSELCPCTAKGLHCSIAFACIASQTTFK